MKPFNLEEAKAGKPVCTRDGYKARILAFDIKDDRYPIIAAVDYGDDKEEILSYTIDGRYDGNESDDDLVMATEKKKGWMCIFKAGKANNDDTIATTSSIFKTKEKAEETSEYSKHYGEILLAIKEIEWEE